MKTLVEKPMLDKTNWHLKQESQQPITHEREILQWLYEFDLDLKEEDIFDILKISRRWYPKYDMMHPGAPAHGLRIMNQAGFLDMVDMYTKYVDGTYLDFDKWKKYYDLGFTSLIPNVLDTHKKLRIISD